MSDHVTRSHGEGKLSWKGPDVSKDFTTVLWKKEEKGEDRKSRVDATQ